MIRSFFLLILLASIFWSCQDVQKPQKPDHFIPEAKMKDILYDVTLMTALRDYSSVRLRSSGIQPDKFIYEKYEIDSTQFAQNLSYYSVDFNRYAAMWEDVSNRLERKREELQAYKDKQDSLILISLDKARDSVAGRNLPISEQIQLRKKPNDSILEAVGD